MHRAGRNGLQFDVMIVLVIGCAGSPYTTFDNISHPPSIGVVFKLRKENSFGSERIANHQSEPRLDLNFAREPADTSIVGVFDTFGVHDTLGAFLIRKRMMEPIERKAVPRAISGNRVDLFVSEDDGVFPVDLPDPLPQVSDQLIESLILSLGGKIPIEIADQADTDRNVIQVIAVDVATGGAGAPNDCRFQSVRYRRTCHCR